MSTCILHVTDHEFAKILQLNHDSLIWSNRNRLLLDRLGKVLGRQVIHDLRQFEQCRMQPHHDLDGLPRVEKIEAHDGR